MKNSSKYFEKGFSMVEFSVVVAIMGILAFALTKSVAIIGSTGAKRLAMEITVLDQILEQHHEQAKGPLGVKKGMLPMKNILENGIFHGSVNKYGAIASKYRKGNYWILVDLDLINGSSKPRKKGQKEKKSNIALVLTSVDGDERYGSGSITAMGFRNLNSKLGDSKPNGIAERLSMAKAAETPHREPHKIKGLRKINISRKQKSARERYNLILKLSPQDPADKK
ncbi:MAG: prepilin-type N-terminal cleavage/methylation domain-containing protein [Rickettsiales bacterium]|jgi:prepilin-type N-terminal cleavage/methylation domain-containing protein|nr:prepilin-type N-terminal cleavage/methylation domain-containing protein [Rickettsiales bacterium]